MAAKEKRESSERKPSVRGFSVRESSIREASILISESSIPELPVRFDLFELDPENCQLRRSGLPVELSPQALRLLALLVARPNELVTRDEIKQALWPQESYGDFDGRLNFTVKKLREVLGDSVEHPRYIQTVRKAGYRFIAPVQARSEISPGVADTPGQLAAPASARIESSTSESRFRLGGNALLLTFVVLGTFALITTVFLRLHATASAGFRHDKPSTVADDSYPAIDFVSPLAAAGRQKIVIRGHGFGMHVPYEHTDSPYLAIRDNTVHWAAGRLVPYNWDEVMLDVESWTTDEIVVSGFSGRYGQEGWKLSAGDEIEIAVWNPQNGVGPALFHTAVVSSPLKK